EYLLNSRLPFTILQPMHYMQNINVARSVKEGVFSLPYNMEIPLSHVDLMDVAEVAVKVLTEEGHLSATYELCGSDFLRGVDIASIISEVSGYNIVAKEIKVDDFVKSISFPEMPDYTIDTLYRLFIYYGRYGIVGNPNVLTWLLSRAPTTFVEYV